MSKETVDLFAGERIDPFLLSLKGIKNQWEVTGKIHTPWRIWHNLKIHESRYRFASLQLDLEVGVTVLDLACGTGYGNRFINKNANWYGVDISEQALRFGKQRNYQEVNKQRLITADGRSLPFARNCFDAVVSLETMEHIPLEDAGSFLQAIKFVIKPGGRFVISAPNRDFTNPEGTIKSKPRNRFHCFEPNLSELKGMLEPHFTNLNYYYQTGEIFKPGHREISQTERRIRALRAESWKVKPLELLNELKETPGVYLAVGLNPF